MSSPPQSRTSSAFSLLSLSSHVTLALLPTRTPSPSPSSTPTHSPTIPTTSNPNPNSDSSSTSTLADYAERAQRATQELHSIAFLALGNVEIAINAMHTHPIITFLELRRNLDVLHIVVEAMRYVKVDGGAVEGTIDGLWARVDQIARSSYLPLGSDDDDNDDDDGDEQ